MNEVFIDMRKENKWIQKHFDKDLVSIDDLLRVIEDLDGEVESLKEELEDFKRDVEDNYRHIPYSDQI